MRTSWSRRAAALLAALGALLAAAPRGHAEQQRGAGAPAPAAAALAGERDGAAGESGGAPADTDALLALECAVQRLVARVAPSVVQVSVRRLVAVDPLLPRRDTVVLSGFVWSADGLVVSLGRAFASAEAIEVRLGGRTLPARLLGTDPPTAIALLRVEPAAAGQEFVPLARAATPAPLRPGSLVLAFGNAYGQGGSVALGNVAALERTLAHQGRRLEGLIQVTTPVHPGDPGGPLVNVRGEVVGVVGGALGSAGPALWSERQRLELAQLLERLLAAAIEPEPAPQPGGERAPAPAESGEGAAAAHARRWARLLHAAAALPAGAGHSGYALPIARVEDVVERLRAESARPRPWLGLQVLSVDAAVAARLGVELEHGALVLGVLPGSPAARAGVQPHDVLVRFGEVPIEHVHHLQRLLAESQPGQRVVLEVVRAGERQRLEIRLEPR